MKTLFVAILTTVASFSVYGLEYSVIINDDIRIWPENSSKDYGRIYPHSSEAMGVICANRSIIIISSEKQQVEDDLSLQSSKALTPQSLRVSGVSPLDAQTLFESTIDGADYYPRNQKIFSVSNGSYIVFIMRKISCDAPSKHAAHDHVCVCIDAATGAIVDSFPGTEIFGVQGSIVYYYDGSNNLPVLALKRRDVVSRTECAPICNVPSYHWGGMESVLSAGARVFSLFSYDYGTDKEGVELREISNNEISSASHRFSGRYLCSDGKSAVLYNFQERAMYEIDVQGDIAFRELIRVEDLLNNDAVALQDLHDSSVYVSSSRDEYYVVTSHGPRQSMYTRAFVKNEHRLVVKGEPLERGYGYCIYCNDSGSLLMVPLYKAF